MREGELQRKTKETDINLRLNLDGTGICTVDSGVGFLDHMLELFAVHGSFDINLTCRGDLEVDAHHSVEDIGIALGTLIDRLLGDRRGISRYGAQYVPMDEALARAVIDISGRPFLSFTASSLKGKSGGFDTELVEEFFRALTVNARLTAHIEVLAGRNRHHMAEAVFKAFSRALCAASRLTSNGGIPSSKGTL